MSFRPTAWAISASVFSAFLSAAGSSSTKNTGRPSTAWVKGWSAAFSARRLSSPMNCASSTRNGSARPATSVWSSIMDVPSRLLSERIKRPS
jgi:hypothetical protein